MEEGIEVVDWTLDKEFKDSLGNKVHLLQRPLVDLDDAKDDELLPFFGELSLFRMKQSDNKGNADAIRGVLVDLRTDTTNLTMRILPIGNPRELVWTVEGIATALLSVWRVNGFLDALQVSVTGTHNAVYMQVGGGALADICVEGDAGNAPEAEIADAMEMFYRNIGGRADGPPKSG